MSAAELEFRVAVCLRNLFAATDPEIVPPAWARHVHGLALRWRLQQVDPDSDEATVLFTVMGRLGLVVAE